MHNDQEIIQGVSVVSNPAKAEVRNFVAALAESRSPKANVLFYDKQGSHIMADNIGRFRRPIDFLV
jgi:hypothetical protein